MRNGEIGGKSGGVGGGDSADGDDVGGNVARERFVFFDDDSARVAYNLLIRHSVLIYDDVCCFSTSNAIVSCLSRSITLVNEKDFFVRFSPNIIYSLQEL